ncbi:ATG13 domain-containing protein [Psidium guajava]|nr:ATG13 domain-containing protein [Psidium guajava]
MGHLNTRSVSRVHLLQYVNQFLHHFAQARVLLVIVSIGDMIMAHNLSFPVAVLIQMKLHNHQPHSQKATNFKSLPSSCPLALRLTHHPLSDSDLHLHGLLIFFYQLLQPHRGHQAALLLAAFVTSVYSLSVACNLHSSSTRTNLGNFFTTSGEKVL